MSLIKKLTLEEKVGELDYPGSLTFKIKIAAISKEKLTKIRKTCLEMRFNSKSKQREEVLDEDKFYHHFSRAVIKGWSGFTYRDLATLVILDDSLITDWDAEIPYTPEDAEELLKSSIDFDRVINDLQEVVSSSVEADRLNEKKV